MTTAPTRPALAEALAALADFTASHPEVPTFYAVEPARGYTDEPEGRTILVRWYLHSAEEARAFVRALPADADATKYSDYDGSPRLLAWLSREHGVQVEACRLDTVCRLVETDEVEEVVERRTVTPAEYETVTVTRPVMKRECPPFLAD